MFCEFLGAEREGQTYQLLLIGEYNQSQRNPFVLHTTLPESSVVLTVYTILLGLIINSLVQALCGAVWWTRWNAVVVSAYIVSVH